MKPVVKILEWNMTKRKLPKWHFHRWSNVIKIQLLKFSFCINEYIFWQIQIELINGFRCFVSFSFWKLFIRMFVFDSNQWNAVVWTRIAIFNFFESIDWESLWSFPNKNVHLNKSNLIVTLLWLDKLLWAFYENDSKRNVLRLRLTFVFVFVGISLILIKKPITTIGISSETHAFIVSNKNIVLFLFSLVISSLWKSVDAVQTME